VQAINLAANIFKEAKDRGYTKMNLLDIGGGFPAPYDDTSSRSANWPASSTANSTGCFPKNIQILAEPGRFLVATAATAVSKIIGKAVRDGKLCYYINDGVYHTFSGVIFDHCHYHLKAFKRGPTQICSVFGPTCDALDVVSMAEELPGDLNWATCSTATTSAPTATPPRPGSTASRRARRPPPGRGRRSQRRSNAAEVGAGHRPDETSATVSDVLVSLSTLMQLN
jgi:hypothetical protein